LPRAAAFLRALVLADLAWAKSLGATIARRASEQCLRLAGFEVRTARWSNRQPNGGAGHGGLAWLRFLWPLFHPRSLDVALHDVIHFRSTRSLEIRNAQLSLVQRHWVGRHDSFQGDVHH